MARPQDPDSWAQVFPLLFLHSGKASRRLIHANLSRTNRFSPTDTKFATCADDATVKIWDFATGVEERSLTGHGWDIKCMDWHRSKGLIVTGSKDNLIKLWDPRKTSELCTLYHLFLFSFSLRCKHSTTHGRHGAKSMITSVGFNLNGHYLANTAKEQSVRIWDMRMLREIVILKGNTADVNCTISSFFLLEPEKKDTFSQ